MYRVFGRSLDYDHPTSQIIPLQEMPPCHHAKQQASLSSRWSPLCKLIGYAPRYQGDFGNDQRTGEPPAF